MAFPETLGTETSPSRSRVLLAWHIFGGRVSHVGDYSSPCTPTSSPRRRVAVTLSSSDIPSPHPLGGLKCLDGSHRAGQGNLIRYTPALDEGYVPGNYFAKWTARSRWHTENSYASQEEHVRKGLWFPTPPRFPDSTRGRGSDLPFRD